MITKPRGTRDLYGEDMQIYEFMYEETKKIFDVGNINKLQTPTFEATELFERGVGGDTDIVTKEMYSFLDKSNRNMTLRPEGTAGAVRAFIENGMNSLPSPQKFWYFMPIFRYEKVQKGRQREFTQIGLEFFGSENPEADFEVIYFGVKLLKAFGILDKCKLKINSIGCDTCRPKYKTLLKEFLIKNKEKYCEDCQRRMDTNVLRVLDCKEEVCQTLNIDAPKITESLCDECKNHFEKLKEYLKFENINYEIDTNIVRGLDYYNRTVFEFLDENGKAVLGGGRYDGLSKVLGGPDLPAVGFAIGVERMMEVIKNDEILMQKIRDRNRKEIFVISENIKSSIEIVEKLRNMNIKTEYDLLRRSMRSNLKYADKENFKYVLFLNDNNKILKNLVTGDEIEINNIEEIEKIVKN